MIYVLIPAAGSGTRMGKGTDKLFMEIGGVPVIERTLQAFSKFSEKHDIRCIIAAGANKERITALAASYPFVAMVIEGGPSRTASVTNLVKSLEIYGPKDDDIVFVHDAARCLISSEVLERCVKSSKEHEVCVAGVKAKNTIKTVDPSGKVISTPDRSSLVEVQTPQCFSYAAIRDAYDNAVKNGIEATDDTALAELIGKEVYIVEGDYRNIKITTPEDISFASSLI
ncbi:MAG: 2-C-methyl-D-erythritol 4-phosphate cytidylyltransferase [Clostridiales bacterium]|nr:2-C-methyl-D-erythritol 4-phosphate cytidylyltransferase [Clostridiales bacterium]